MSKLEKFYINHIEQSINNARLLKSSLLPFHLRIDGMSSDKNRHLFNNLLSMKPPYNPARKVRYLEIGSWKGSTFCASIFNNNIEAFSIENYSEFLDASFKGQHDIHPKDAFTLNLAKTEALSKINSEIYLIRDDCFSIDIFEPDIGLFDVYFYDGEHSFESHKKAFTHFNDCLQDTFIAVVDDIQEKPGQPVYEATKEAFAELKYTVVKEWYLNESINHTIEEAMNGWWNGLYIAVIKKNIK